MGRLAADQADAPSGGSTRPTAASLWPAAMGLIVVGYALQTAYVLTRPIPWVLDFCFHDDTFYYLKTARHFAAGLGSTFDGTNYTNGYHPLWFLVIAGLWKLGPGPTSVIYWAIALEALLFAASMVMLMGFMRRRGIGVAVAASAVAVVYLAIVPIIGWNVLESGLVSLLAAMALLLFDRFDRGRLTVTLAAGMGLVLALAALARLDLTLLAVAVSPLLLWRAWRAREGLAALIAFALPLVVLVGGYLLVNYITTGYFQPVSGRSKAALTFGDRGPAWTVITALLPTDLRQTWKLGVWAAGGVLIADLRRRRLTAVGCFSATLIALYAYYRLRYERIGAGNHWYYLAHYLFAAYGLATAGQWLVDRRPRWSSVVVGGACVAAVAMVALRGRELLRYGERSPGPRAQSYEMALMIRDLVPPAARIGMWDAGIIGYFSERTVVNLDGLMNTHEYLDRYRIPGREVEYVRQQRFEYVVAYPHFFGAGSRQARLLEDYDVLYRGHVWILRRRAG